MSKILCIETSTEVCSAAITENGEVIDFREDTNGQNHSKLLTVYIDELLKSNGFYMADLDAVAVSEGPGSYTGLRIGVSVAKGICYAISIPMIAISPLQAMAYHVISNLPDYNFENKHSDIFVPMIDARRMEVYTAIFDSQCHKVSDVEALVIDENSYGNKYECRLFYFGNGALKCQKVLVNSNFIYINNIITSSKNMSHLANEKFQYKQFVDVAYFEPFYLKDFIVTVGKKKVI